MNMPAISAWCNELEARVLTPGYETTPRDVAEAVELVNVYLDELERIERTLIVAPVTDIDEIANQIVERWYPNE